MTDLPMVQLLRDAGFESGWALSDDTLILWEHDQDPPAPLKRPEVTGDTDTGNHDNL